MTETNAEFALRMRARRAGLRPGETAHPLSSFAFALEVELCMGGPLDIELRRAIQPNETRLAYHTRMQHGLHLRIAGESDAQWRARMYQGFFGERSDGRALILVRHWDAARSKGSTEVTHLLDVALRHFALLPRGAGRESVEPPGHTMQRVLDVILEQHPLVKLESPRRSLTNIRMGLASGEQVYIDSASTDVLRSLLVRYDLRMWTPEGWPPTALEMHTLLAEYAVSARAPAR